MNATNTTNTTAPQEDPRADCTVDEDGRITWHLRLPATTPPRLLLRLRPRKGEAEGNRHVLGLDRVADDSWRAVLEPGLRLAEGRWDAYALLGPDEERLRLRSGLRDLRALVTAHTREHPAPVAVRIPYATKEGYLAVRAWLRDAHAETSTLTTTDRSMTVSAGLHGAYLAEDAAVVLRRRGQGGEERRTGLDASADRRGFSFTVDYGDLSADGPGRIWDVFVHPGADAPRIRVGRLLDDVADRKTVFVHPAAAVSGSLVRPYYTADNDLSVEITSA
ncbi:transferase [Streptomyces sp. GC420]|nr:transferase [Streptomyces sp. GC420]